MIRRQSTTEEILIARGFRRQSTTEEMIRCRNFRRQSSQSDDACMRARGRRDSSTQILDGTIGTMTVETTSTFFDSSTQTEPSPLYDNNHYHEECLRCNSCGLNLTGPNQDYDSNMFRLQPTNTVASSGLGLGWRQRLGRADTIYLRRIHSQTETRQSEGFGSTSVLPITAGARRRKSTQRWTPSPPLLFGSINRYTARVGWRGQRAPTPAGPALPARDPGGPRPLPALGAARTTTEASTRFFCRLRHQIHGLQAP